jgi:hypothetical protein
MRRGSSPGRPGEPSSCATQSGMNTAVLALLKMLSVNVVINIVASSAFRRTKANHPAGNGSTSPVRRKRSPRRTDEASHQHRADEERHRVDPQHRSGRRSNRSRARPGVRRATSLPARTPHATVDAASAATATALARLASTDVRRGPRLSITARFPGGEITWTVPSGGFFVVVTVPFPVDDVLLEKSAHEYGVLWTPMSHFYDGDTPIHVPAVLQFGHPGPDRHRPRPPRRADPRRIGPLGRGETGSVGDTGLPLA